MVEQDIDPKILELLTAANPNLNLLREEPSQDAASKWPGVQLDAYKYVNRHGYFNGEIDFWINGVERPSDTYPSQPTLDPLEQIRTRFSVKTAWFPYGETKLHLMFAVPVHEQNSEWKQSPETPDLFSEVIAPVPSIISRAQWASRNNLLLFRSEAWDDRVWFRVPPAGAKAVSPFMVSCVEAMLTLDERYLATVGHTGHS